MSLEKASSLVINYGSYLCRIKLFVTFSISMGFGR